MQIAEISVPPEAEGTAMLVPFAGGSAQLFFSWRAFISKRVALYAVELPGRGRCAGMPFSDSVFDLAEQVCDSIMSRDLNLEVIFGHSLGALIVFEILRALRRRNAPMPRTCVLSGRISPTLPSSCGLPKLTKQDLVNYLKDLGGTPQSVLESESILEMTLPVLRADLEMIGRYHHTPESPLSTDAIVLGGMDDDRVPLPGLLEWQSQFCGSFDLRMYSGGHFFVEQHRSSIATLLENSSCPTSNPAECI